MAARRALVIDADHRFCELLRGSLGPYGFEIQVSLAEDEWLHAVETSPPDLVFVAVDLPESLGFATFAKLRSVVKRVPVALATATLSASEMGIHEKLRGHANVYLDKRTLTAEELLRRLEPYLGAPAGPTPPVPTEDASSAVSAFDDSDPETWLERFSREGLDPELAAELDRALGSANRTRDRGPRRAAPASNPGSARIAELEVELERTRQELQDARREARSSPFSGDFLSLRQVASRREADVGRLHAELRERDHRIAQLEGLIETLGRRLVPLTREREQAVERAEELRSRTENAEAESRRAIAQSEEWRKRHEAASIQAKASLDLERQEHARAREIQELAMADLKASYADHLERAAREHSASVQALQRQHHDELASRQRAHEKALARGNDLAQATLREALARDRAAVEARFEASDQERAKALAALREKHERDLQALERAQRQDLARAEKSAREARDFAVAAEEAVSRERLETQRREHERAMVLLRKQHQDAMAILRASMDEEIAGRERNLRTVVSDAVSAERTQWQGKLEEAVQEHANALAALQKQHAGELAALRSAQQHASTTRERESQAAQSRALAQERSRWEEKLEKAKREHDTALRDALALEMARFEEGLALRKLESEDERARELEGQLEETTRDLLARDAALAALQQERAQREDSTAALEAVMRDLVETVESLVDDGAPPDLIVVAVRTTLAGLSRPGRNG